MWIDRVLCIGVNISSDAVLPDFGLDRAYVGVMYAKELMGLKVTAHAHEPGKRDIAETIGVEKFSSAGEEDNYETANKAPRNVKIDFGLGRNTIGNIIAKHKIGQHAASIGPGKKRRRRSTDIYAPKFLQNIGKFIRRLDFGTERTAGNNLLVRHHLGLYAVSNPNSPGKKRRRRSSISSSTKGHILPRISTCLHEAENSRCKRVRKHPIVRSIQESTPSPFLKFIDAETYKLLYRGTKQKVLVKNQLRLQAKAKAIDPRVRISFLD